MLKNAKVKNRLSFSLKNITLFTTLILSTSLLYPKRIDVCLSGGVVLQNNYNYLQIDNFEARFGGYVIGALQFSFKDLMKGVYPFIRLTGGSANESEVGKLFIYKTILINGGFEKHFKIENSSVDILLSAGNRWEKYDITYFSDEMSNSFNTILLSVGGRIRSPLYKRLYTSIGYDYFYGKSQHLSVTREFDPDYEIITCGSLHLWTIGLGIEF